ncbi:AfsR/SARP family transcriptional regulator [Nonomuraea diastatica]|uniref:AfsR/SARP family transcriptional regulator n=1 Tax=Nonomuraea diastatica TaxID=1848329 RepID=UPI00140BB52F|nr:BTAD domain-containing putative transcriptional regulator [Nonomuraea diastatica]
MIFGRATAGVGRVPGVRFLLLGPLEVAVDGRAVHLTGRQRALLAALLLDAGHVVSVERLADSLWGDELPPSAPSRVRALIAELRRALGDHGQDVIVTRNPGYLVRAAATDTAELASLVARGHRAAEDGRHPEAADRYDEALALWRGEPYQDLAGPVAHAERHRLEELKHEAAEGRAAALVEMGRGQAAVAGLTRLLAEVPLRERPHGLLMRALAGGGRLPDALEVYRDFRARLVEELGVEPSGELQRLHQRLLAGEPAADPPAGPSAEPPAGPSAESPAGPPTEPSAGPSAGPPGESPAAPVPRQLPPLPGGFVGRAEELRRMDAGRVTLVVGPAGVGKTALAVHWAHRAAAGFPDGQLFVDMRGFDQREPMTLPEALRLLLQGLGQAAKDIPVELDAQIALYRSLLAGRRVMVVLDDVAAPEHVRALLPGDPGCRAVITSRNRLGGLVALDGVERVTLDVLDQREALRLIAHGIGEDRLRREREAAAELVALCDRLPLALSIAMSWIGDHEHRMIGHYVRELADRGRLVRLRVDGDESVAVQAALDLSHQALPPPARRMFRLLGVARGAAICADAAAALAGTSREQAEDLLGAAVRIHLLKETGPRRFAAHDLVVEYAVRLSLAEDPPEERHAAAHRLLEHYLRTVVRATAAAGFVAPRPPGDLAGPEVTPKEFGGAEEAAGWFDAEWDNLAAAVSHAAEHGPRPYAWLLVEAMTDLLQLRRTHAEWLRLAGIALDAAEREEDLIGQAAMRNSLGLVRWLMADLEGAMREYERALALARRAGWAHGEATALQGGGVVRKQLGKPQRALPRYRRAMAIHRALGNERGESRAQNNLASAYLMLARLDRAEECLVANLPLAEAAGDRLLQALTLVNLALVRQKQARFGEALECLDKALSVARAAGLRYAVAVTYETYGWVHRDAGRHGQAVDAFARSLAIAREVENRRCQIASLSGMAEAELELGRMDSALARLEAALRLAERTGTDLDQVLLGLAEAHYRGGRHADARDEAERALKLAQDANPLNLPRLYGLLAAVHLADGDTAQSVRACEQALRLAHRSGQRLEHARALLTLGHAREPHAPEQALRHWRRAHELFTAIGASERLKSAALLDRR